MIEYKGLKAFEDSLYNSFNILEDSIPLPNWVKIDKILSFSGELSGKVLEISKTDLIKNEDDFSNLAKINLHFKGTIKYKNSNNNDIISYFDFTNEHIHYLSLPETIEIKDITKLYSNILRMFISKRNKGMYYSILCQVGVDTL